MMTKQMLAKARKAAVAAGAWYWFKAETAEENLNSALMRMAYQSAVDVLKAEGVVAPAAAELYVAAASKWPVARLHPAPKATEMAKADLTGQVGA
jgi:predicted class III extradiol MEMO1 family dioxygenase